MDEKMKKILLAMGLAAALAGCNDEKKAEDACKVRVEAAVKQAMGTQCRDTFRSMREEYSGLQESCKKQCAEMQSAAVSECKTMLSNLRTECGLAQKAIQAEKAELEKSVQTECQIRNVMPSSIWAGFSQSYGFTHDFEYVHCVNQDRALTLIYPSSRLIVPGIAKIAYAPVENGKISSVEFMKQYVKVSKVELKEYVPMEGAEFRVDNFNIYADGIIIEDGIKYK